MRRRARHAVVLLLALLVALASTACGGSSGSRDEGGSTATTGSDTDSDPDAPTEETPDDDGDDAAAEPTPVAIAERRVLDRLAAAFAPVSARVNFVVAAETLRADAVDGNAGDDVERERAGLVRIEVDRMRDVLAATRPKVAAVPVRSVAQQRVQQLLLEAIDVRTRAMDELVAALDADGRDLGDSLVEERLELWQRSWQDAYRSTREATTVSQERRAELGLEPAPEEALR